MIDKRWTGSILGQLVQKNGMLWATLLLAVVTLTGCSHQFSGLVFDDPAPVANIPGTNYDGMSFSLDEHAGEMTLIFFGYTYCPDICPLTLAEMTGARRIIQQENPALAEDLNLLFVTVDPARDTLSRMREYLRVFDPDIYGVLLGDEALTQVKSAYGVYGEIDEPPQDGEAQSDSAGSNTEESDTDGSNTAGDAEGYTVTHTGSLFLMDRENRLKAIYRSDVSASALAEDLTVLLRR